MKKAFRITAIAALLALGIWIFQILFPPEEKRIRRLLAQAAEAAEVNPKQNPLFKLAGANRLVGCFSPDAVLQVEVPGVQMRTIHGHDDLLQAVTAALAGLQEARIQLHRVHVSVDPGRQSATAQLVTAAYLNGSSEPMVQELRIRLRKIEDHWKIVQVETVKTLGR